MRLSALVVFVVGGFFFFLPLKLRNSDKHTATISRTMDLSTVPKSSVPSGKGCPISQWIVTQQRIADDSIVSTVLDSRLLLHCAIQQFLPRWKTTSVLTLPICPVCNRAEQLLPHLDGLPSRAVDSGQTSSSLAMAINPMRHREKTTLILGSFLV